MRAPSTYLLVGLAGALVLYALSRTQRGHVAASTAVGFVMNAITPRGIRNNNPGNLEYLPPSRAWRGQVGNDGRFGVYDSAANGVRAIGQQLLKYARSGIDTVHGLISTWAPGHENPTDAYVSNVARALGVSATQRIDVHAALPALAEAIIRQENGQQPYAAADLRAWVYS